MSEEILLDTIGRRLTDENIAKYKYVNFGSENVTTETISEDEDVSATKEGNPSEEIKNSLTRSLNRKIDYNIHQDNNQIVIQVLDGETGEVIREISQQDFVRLAEQTSHFNKGLLDETA